jgi:predicted RNase H-like nuclease (RuvC/YqgF family)
VNFLDHGLIPGIVAIITWLIRGKYAEDSAAVKQARSVLEMWERTASRQDEQLTALRSQVQALEAKIAELQAEVDTLRDENTILKGRRVGKGL